MPRSELLKGRYSKPQHMYHVTICTEKRAPWFNNLFCGRVLVQQMMNLHNQDHVTSMAWVIMPDHLHWLFQLNNNLSLSDVMKNLKAKSAIKINQMLHRKGVFWQKGFYDHALRKEEDIKKIARYIVANPLRAGLVGDIGNYALWDAAWVSGAVE